MKCEHCLYPKRQKGVNTFLVFPGLFIALPHFGRSPQILTVLLPVTRFPANEPKRRSRTAKKLKEVERRTAGLQKVSDRVELSKPAANTVNNNQ